MRGALQNNSIKHLLNVIESASALLRERNYDEVYKSSLYYRNKVEAQLSMAWGNYVVDRLKEIPATCPHRARLYRDGGGIRFVFTDHLDVNKVVVCDNTREVGRDPDDFLAWLFDLVTGFQKDFMTSKAYLDVEHLLKLKPSIEEILIYQTTTK